MKSLPAKISLGMNYFYYFLVIALLSVACSKPSSSAAQIASITTVTFKESNEDFPNPERGFYRYSETNADNFIPLSLNQLKEWRDLTPADNGNYNVYSTLVFRYYILDSFKDKPMSAAFLNSIITDFSIVRIAGFKVIPRFTFTNRQKSGNCPEGFICPPYGDAPKQIALQHIAQLKKILYENADVIACVQMGFVGVWGEQYYTDYYGDASANAGQGKLLDQNWKDRIEVLNTLLDAVPKNRMVQVRYPQLKQRAIYGINALTDVAPLLEAEGFSQTEKARIGFHNDCFLASPDDFGTYEDYGNSTSDRKTSLSVLKKYVQDDSKYVVVGGETCNDAYSPQNDCEPAGIAQQEMAKLHYSFLNCAYNNSVNNDWQTGGCMQLIKKNLGYRFVLRSASFPKSISAGQFLSFTIELVNRGYASCYNPRPVNIVFRNTSNSQQFIINTDGDPRRWYSGNIRWESSAALPADIIPGKYEVFLAFPDQYSSIASRPEYAIRLANENVWESATGYNKLGLQVEVK